MGAEYSEDKKTLVASGSCNGAFEVKDGTKCIGEGAFRDSRNLTKVVLPESVNEICKRAFSCCGELEKITIPKAVSSIGKYAFEYCYNLKYMRIESDDINFDLNALSVGNFSNKMMLECLEIGGGVNILYVGYDDLRERKYPDIKVLKVFGCKERLEIPDTSDKIIFDFVESIIDFVDGCPKEIVFSGYYSCERFKFSELRINQSINSVGSVRVQSLKKLCERYRKPSANLIFAAPEVCEEQSSIPGFIKVTRVYDLNYRGREYDEVVDINTKYIFMTEPLIIDRYSPVDGCRISIASRNSEGYAVIDVYESKEMVDEKIKHSLENLSRQVGGVAGLLNELEMLLEKDK